MGEKMWSVATTVAAIMGGTMAKKVIEGVWTKAKDGDDSPSNPADPNVNWGEALAFAVVSGAIVQIVRAVVNRESTKAFTKAKGELPKSVRS
ncbi:MAG TPA: DUF4235 domain-containing protein [Ornithinimicrobium sp.]|uniref:DUF4235 domain-containing protein n=1 Tax=Ornithinimicrobium sp. TaxID=1977084 RepID=UPI002B48E329|nr:DUF4235 domain-containing protein [Ornithinimicrobium sp.]HKJ12251.1 DUF4235 domain-containing protein [Ornithinimicrobium sp.]